MVDKYWLDFWCLHCELKFVGEPDELGDEQAKCPECGDVCLTFEEEFEDALRARSQNQNANSCMGCFLSMAILGPILGPIIGTSYAATREEDDLPNILQQPPPNPDKIIGRMTDQTDAKQLVDRLYEYGIIATISDTVENSVGVTYYEVAVPNRDFSKATRFMTG